MLVKAPRSSTPLLFLRQRRRKVHLGRASPPPLFGSFSLSRSRCRRMEKKAWKGANGEGRGGERMLFSSSFSLSAKLGRGQIRKGRRKNVFVSPPPFVLGRSLLLLLSLPSASVDMDASLLVPSPSFGRPSSSFSPLTILCLGDRPLHFSFVQSCLPRRDCGQGSGGRCQDPPSTYTHHPFRYP